MTVDEIETNVAKKTAELDSLIPLAEHGKELDKFDRALEDLRALAQEAKSTRSISVSASLRQRLLYWEDVRRRLQRVPDEADWFRSNSARLELSAAAATYGRLPDVALALPETFAYARERYSAAP